MSGPKEILASAKRNPGGFFKLIGFGSLGISIQGSQSHYCSPRINLENLTNYDSLEIAILELYDDEKYFVNIREDDRFKDFEWADRFEPGSNPVAGYVPILEVEKIMIDVMSAANKMKN